MRRSAFTLVEMLAANVLAAVLMLAILGVLSSLGRSNKAIQQHQAAQDRPQSLLESLRADLVTADTVQRQDNALLIRGHGGLDRRDLSPLNAPAVVEYRIIARSGIGVLVRTQKDLVTPQREAWSEVVCCGVQSLELDGIGGKPAMPPGGLRVHVVFEGARPEFDEMVVLR